MVELAIARRTNEIGASRPSHEHVHERGGAPTMRESALDGDHSTTPVTESVVLLDDAGRPTGSMAKADVHGTRTPLHLAFSCYVFDRTGDNLLLTRRAITKRTWPGVWSNSFCGHPSPDEGLQLAVSRRGREELGIDVQDPRVVLPDFRYQATDPGGIVENERCPILVATCDDDPSPDADEVMEWAWVDWTALQETATAAPMLLSPWMVLQLSRLDDWTL
jgi:isopentenyl-diphosphate delta-isomerase